MADKRVNTAIGRLSYPYIFERSKPMGNETEGKFQCEVIFDNEDQLANVKAAIEQAIADKWPKRPNKLRLPIKDGDEHREGKTGYEGKVFIGARSNDKPGVVVGPNRRTTEDKNEVYAGCYVKVSVTAFAYDHPQGGKGVSLALNHVWKIRDGKPFGTMRDAQSDFDGEEVDAEAFGETISSLL